MNTLLIYPTINGIPGKKIAALLKNSRIFFGQSPSESKFIGSDYGEISLEKALTFAHNINNDKNSTHNLEDVRSRLAYEEFLQEQILIKKKVFQT